MLAATLAICGSGTAIPGAAGDDVAQVINPQLIGGMHDPRADNWLVWGAAVYHPPSRVWLAAGSNGTLLRSTDQARTWRSVSTGSVASFETLCADSQRVWQAQGGAIRYRSYTAMKIK